MKPVQHAPKWRTLTIEKTITILGVDPASGLSNAEVLSRRAEYGSNIIPDPPRASIISLWLRQFKNPLIGILLFAGAILLILEHVSDATVILSVLVINSLIGTFHEYRAQKTVMALKKLTPSNTVVRRGGNTITIPAGQIVRGDILVLSEGDRIVADARLLEASFLRLNESLLTGESAPITKDPIAKQKQRDPLDAPMMVFAGTSITHGNGLAVVVATGAQTKLGAISANLQESRTPIPLEKDISMLSRIVLCVIAGLLLVVIALGLRTGIDLAGILFIAVALAVSAIPEGLPVVLTIVLSTGMWRMAKRNVLIKKLFAVEALGQMRVLALDKTGTITFNEMMVSRVWTATQDVKITGEGYMPRGSFFLNGHLTESAELPMMATLARQLSVLNHAKITRAADGNAFVSGDPTEAALSVFAQKLNITTPTGKDLRSVFPFDYERKYSAAEIALSETESEYVIAGAPETIVTACSSMRDGDKIQSMNSSERGALAAQLEVMAERGLRVVALASKRGGVNAYNANSIREYTFEAFIGISDAVRPEAAAMVARVKGAGLRVVMITGDLPTTARAIAHEVGIFERGDHVLTGKELHDLNENELRVLLPRVSVFARVTPEDKLRIVELYQKTGLTLAMTGDGVNDAPSLVKADLGIAMGKSGTDVARQASDVLLLNDNLESIVAAIDEGRAMYQSLRKVLVYLFATNFGEICIVATAIALQLPIPITAAQIIWLNLVTDGFLDVALALEPKDAKDAVPKLKRTRYLLQKSDFISIVLTGLIMTIGTLYMYTQNDHLPLATRQTIVVIVMAMFQWIHAWAIRTERRSFFQTSPLRNPYLIGATVIVVLLQVAAVSVPWLSAILNTTPVPSSIWLQALGVASSLLVVEEIRKFYRRRKH